MCRQGQMIRWTSQKHQKQWLTCWGCADKEKWSNGLHRSIKNSHLHPEDVQTWRNGQTDSTEASKTVTYILRMCRQREMVRWTSQKHREQLLTCWGCADKDKWSDGLHRSIRNSDLHAEDVQTRRNGQMDSTEASRTVTYMLRMCRHGEMVRHTPQKHQEQSLTSWKCANKEKWSDGLHRSIKNSHLHPENVQTRRNGQMDVTEVQKHLPYELHTAFICAV